MHCGYRLASLLAWSLQLNMHDQVGGVDCVKLVWLVWKPAVYVSVRDVLCARREQQLWDRQQALMDRMQQQWDEERKVSMGTREWRTAAGVQLQMHRQDSHTPILECTAYSWWQHCVRVQTPCEAATHCCSGRQSAFLAGMPE